MSEEISRAFNNKNFSYQYGGANRMHINFAYDILNKKFFGLCDRGEE